MKYVPCAERKYAPALFANTVNVGIDETGNGVGIFQFDDFQSIFVPGERGCAAGGNDLAFIAQNPGGIDPFVRSQTVINDE